jgi:hypothetical protein
MTQHHRNALAAIWPGGKLGVYLAFISLAGVASFVYALVNITPERAVGILLLACIGAFLQAAPIPLLGTPLQGSSLSIASAISFTTLLLWGPAPAMLVNLGSAATTSFYPQRRPLFKVAFNASTLLLAALAAGVVYWALGGTIPTTYTFENILATMVAALT